MMANALMASSSTSKLLLPNSISSKQSHRRYQPLATASLRRISVPITRNLRSAVKASAFALLAVASPLPALAVEKAELFDFNLTLPAIAAEFLLLMVILDKIYFTPLGKFMDDRDAKIRSELSGVKDTSSEVKELEEKASAVLKAARAEIAAALNEMKKETTKELEQKLYEGRLKVEAELEEALAALEKQKQETIKSLNSDIAKLSEDIVKKVLPA